MRIIWDFFKAAARRSKRGCRGKLHRCNGGREQARVLSRDLNTLNDSGAIKGMDAREDGVYITYVPTSGADAVTKKLGNIASGIFVQGSNKNSETKVLPKGVYRLMYQSSCYSKPERCPIINVYVNGKLYCSERAVVKQDHNDSTDYSVCAGIKDINLTADSSVYINLSAGQYSEYASAVLSQISG